MKLRQYVSAISAFTFSLAALSAQADELKCEGPFAKDSDHNRLVTVFGQSNVAKTIVHEESEQLKASTVFSKDPARSVQITWWDEKARKRPSSIQTEGTDWFGPKGIRVGMTLNEVEVLNGGPFTLYGFDWDYGGTTADWKGGAFAHLPGGCNLIVTFEVGENVDDATAIKVAGDSKFSSAQSEMKAVNPKVRGISLAYPRRP